METNEQILNYDGTPVKPGHVLVPTIPDDNDIKANVTNPDCIISLRIPGTAFRTKAVLKAVPESMADLSRQQYNYWQNDQLRHFSEKDTTSTDALEDAYKLERGSDEHNPEKLVATKENAKAIIDRLTEEAPQYLAAAILHRLGLRGAAFQKGMKLGHDRSASLQRELTDILCCMVYDGCESVKLNTRATKHDGFYREIIKENLSEMLDALEDLFQA